MYGEKAFIFYFVKENKNKRNVWRTWQIHRKMARKENMDETSELKLIF